jgi:hypothetical protein
VRVLDRGVHVLLELSGLAARETIFQDVDNSLCYGASVHSGCVQIALSTGQEIRTDLHNSIEPPGSPIQRVHPVQEVGGFIW